MSIRVLSLLRLCVGVLPEEQGLTHSFRSSGPSVSSPVTGGGHVDREGVHSSSDSQVVDVERVTGV